MSLCCTVHTLFLQGGKKGELIWLDTSAADTSLLICIRSNVFTRWICLCTVIRKMGCSLQIKFLLTSNTLGAVQHVAGVIRHDYCWVNAWKIMQQSKPSRPSPTSVYLSNTHAASDVIEAVPTGLFLDKCSLSRRATHSSSLSPELVRSAEHWDLLPMDGVRKWTKEKKKNNP